jgi:ATP-dependent HslUV protease ATP-binding subunit HslU
LIFKGNRVQRLALSIEAQERIQPSNVMLMGTTGVGKTELARRLANFTDAAFTKVEATQFSQVGYHGGDVDTIIKNLYKAAKSMVEAKYRKQFNEQATKYAEEVIMRKYEMSQNQLQDLVEQQEHEKSSFTMFEKMNHIRMRYFDKLMKEVDIEAQAVKAAENGVVFIDEIDKLVAAGIERQTVSTEGVQRDLLPIVEGTTIRVDNNIEIRTDRILFVAAGAFSKCKPKDLLPELLGRFPVEVRLHSLTEEHLYRILVEGKGSCWRQKVELLSKEKLTLSADDEALRTMAKLAYEMNSSEADHGARRLRTIVESVTEDIEFNGPSLCGAVVNIDKDYVLKKAKFLVKSRDYSKYIL